MAKYIITRTDHFTGNSYYKAYKKFLGIFYLRGKGYIEGTCSDSLEICERRLAEKTGGRMDIIIKEIQI